MLPHVNTSLLLIDEYLTIGPKDRYELYGEINILKFRSLSNSFINSKVDIDFFIIFFKIG